MKILRMFVLALAVCCHLLGWPYDKTHAAGARPRPPAPTDQSVPPPATETTWSHDAAPILYKSCAPCHYPGGAGPFSLLTYADARRWGPQILNVTQSRFMPPWLPEPGYGDFADVRRLSDEDRALLKRWVSGGMLPGALKKAPEPPRYDSTWQLGKPDLILRVERPFTLQAGGTDVFNNLVLPYPLKQTHYIRAMEIRPGTPQVVHHANVLVDRTASLRRQYPNDWQSGIPGMELLLDAGNRFDPDSHFLFWKPDTPALVEPVGMPWRLDPGNDLILNIHLKPSGKPEVLDVEVGLYFTNDPPSQQPMLLELERDDALDIPAGDANFVVEDSLSLPVDVEILGVYPHAHYLGHDMQGWAMLPGGEKKWLVWIRDWDIDRQSVYRYKTPLLLPKGTELHMRYLYDNSSANPHNPHSPPVRVTAGNRSVDEMSHLWLQVLPVNTPTGGPDPRLLLEEAWMRKRLSRTPSDPVSLYNLGAALAGQNRFTEAAAVYEQELQLDPANARTLTALAAALDGAGLWQQAQERLLNALQAHPEACDARFDLATLELRHQELKDAETHFRAQLALCPPDAETEADLGATLADEGQTEAARTDFASSLDLDPKNLQALAGLAGIELDEGRVEKAIAHLKVALRSEPGSADLHEQLARAFAQSGDRNAALQELQKAEILKPEDPMVHAALAQVLADTGNLAAAIDEQRMGLNLLEDDPDGWNNLGVLEARLGQAAAARADFEHALRLQPDHAQARINLAKLQVKN